METQQSDGTGSAPEKPECVVCTSPSRYSCPQCNRKTCSLECVRRHKMQFECEGKSRQFSFVPVQQMDESLLLRDVAFLSEVTEHLSSTVVSKSETKRKRADLPPRLSTLLKKAAEGNTLVITSPPGLARFKENSSRWNKQSCSIQWRVEWKIMQNMQETKFSETAVDERWPTCVSLLISLMTPNWCRRLLHLIAVCKPPDGDQQPLNLESELENRCPAALGLLPQPQLRQSSPSDSGCAHISVESTNAAMAFELRRQRLRVELMQHGWGTDDPQKNLIRLLELWMDDAESDITCSTQFPPLPFALVSRVPLQPNNAPCHYELDSWKSLRANFNGSVVRCGAISSCIFFLVMASHNLRARQQTADRFS